MENGQIYSKIIAVMSDVGAIGKNNRNAQQQYNFRGVDDVYNALQPALVKHGVFVAPTVLQSDTSEIEQVKDNGKVGILHKTTITSRFRFYTTDGSFIEADAIGEAIDYSDKASNKAMSAAFKYVCFQVFCIATKELHDGDNDNIEPTKPQAQQRQQPPAQRPQTSASGGNDEPMSEKQSRAIFAICKSKGLNEREFLSAQGVTVKDLMTKNQATTIIETLNAI
jgi:hypothetical protein